MKPISKVRKSKLFICFIEILLICSIILLINACIQCIIPREVVNRDIKPNAVPKVRKEMIIDYSYKNRTYANHFKSLSSEDIVSQIGVTTPLFSEDSVPVFKIKGIDIKKSIAIRLKDSSLYLQAYNNRYWEDQLPKILIYFVLTLIFSATILINLKCNSIYRKN